MRIGGTFRTMVAAAVIASSSLGGVLFVGAQGASAQRGNHGASGECTNLQEKVLVDQQQLQLAEQMHAPQDIIDELQSQLARDQTSLADCTSRNKHEIECNNALLQVQLDNLAIVDARMKMAPESKIDELQKQLAKDQAALDALNCSPTG